MGKTTTLTSKGQVTIPKELRDELGLEAHDKIRFESAGNGRLLLEKARPRLRDLMGSLPTDGLSVEEAMKRSENLRARDLAAAFLSESE
jgi:antitoxin PrlF